MDNTMLKKTIGERVRNFRIQQKYTQAQFAEAIDISINFLSEIENGKKGMSQDTICKLCETFQISADFILLGKEPKIAEKRNLNSTFLELVFEMEIDDIEMAIEYMNALKKIKLKNI